jgi:predicted CoA-substrate-specific enzyme activase
MPLNKGQSLLLGVDVGSVAVKAVLLDPTGRILGKSHVQATCGIAAAASDALSELHGLVSDNRVRVGVTGQGRGCLEHEGCVSDNEVLCLLRGAAALPMPPRSVIEVGGHIARWVSMERGSNGALRLVDFALNDQCAAGVGAFLVQQAGRLRMGIEEFASAALGAAKGASIAGRCAVFAKSDMIHLQQKGTCVADIAYGLCLALARNFQATVLKGRQAPLPVAIAGGGALNAGLVRAFREVLAVGEADLYVMPHALYLGAIGAAHLAATQGDALSLTDLVTRMAHDTRDTREVPGTHEDDEPVDSCSGHSPEAGPTGPFEAWLGVDIGSVSTDFALISSDGKVLDGIYLPTRGRPIDVLREGLAILKDRYDDRLRVLGAGTTGSGRHLAARLLGADLVKNEITAQLAGTVHFFPEVDTIFEIGGQDSKYIRVDGGKHADFVMNKVCAAGTGSFLEEQCEHLGIDVKRHFAPLALRCRQVADLGARCTVFMETELINARRQGASLADVAAGLADSVARNYLQKVVGSHPVGRNIVFQGGVASNGAVVAAFERLLGRPVAVHPYNGTSGAIGVALLARAHQAGRPTTFKGLGAIGSHDSRTFGCRHCENRCEVTQVSIGGARVHFGDTCERYTVRDSDTTHREASVPNLFAEREVLWQASLEAAAPGSGRGRGVIGIPRASIFFEFLPFWTAFFGQLGFEVVLSPPSSSKTLELGTRHLPAETCLPIKAAFGHVASLRHLGADVILLPSLTSLDDADGKTTYGCPYTQAVPFMVRSSMPDRILTPEIRMGRGFGAFEEGMRQTSEVLGLGQGELQEAFAAAQAAQAGFQQSLLQRGRQLLSQPFERALVLLGRPYNLADPFQNLNLGRHLARLGVLAFPQSFLPAGDVDLASAGHDLPWRFPSDAMRTALWASSERRLHPVLVTSFGCGPDAFLQKHIHAALRDDRLLVLEFDEHRGEAGMVTRIEAFLDRISESEHTPNRDRRTIPLTRTTASDLLPIAGRQFAIPYFSDHAYAFQGVFRHLGAEAPILPAADDTVRVAGEEAGSGKECHAYSMLLGDLVKWAERTPPSSPAATYVHPGTNIPCLAMQFADGFRMDLARRGLGHVMVMAPNSQEMLELFGVSASSMLWRGLLATELLVRWMCENRPYELVCGSVDRVHSENLHDLSDSMAADDMAGFLRRAVERMAAMKVDRSVLRPLVGIAGDIYTRINDSANLGLWRMLEAMGCEVWPAPFLVDNIEFGLPHEFSLSLQGRRFQEALVTGLLMMRKEWGSWPVRRRLSPLLTRPEEPGHNEILQFTAPYVGPGSQQLLLLNVAKMVHFARHGADGVINAMCLNCMFGTASAALIDRIRADHGNIPIVNLVYAGTENAALRTKIETFVHQVRAFRRARRSPAEASPLPMGAFLT